MMGKMTGHHCDKLIKGHLDLTRPEYPNITMEEILAPIQDAFEGQIVCSSSTLSNIIAIPPISRGQANMLITRTSTASAWQSSSLPSF
jgi:hypothetical protein